MRSVVWTLQCIQLVDTYLFGELDVDGEDRPMTRSSLRHNTVLEAGFQLVQQLQSVLASGRPALATSPRSRPVVRRWPGAIVT